jgi:hypothetical protein
VTTNPFEFGRELAGDELVDRDDEVAAAAATMRNAGMLFLIGPRRFGKTSILRAAADRARRTGVAVLRYDAEAFPTLEQLSARLLADTASKITSTVERAGNAIREFFSGVRPTATYDAALHKWSVSLAGATGRSSGAPLLADVLDGVDRAAAKSKKRVAVVIDEFQRVIEQDATAEAQMRAAMQRHRHVGYVLAGSATRLLADMTGNPARPFYKLGEVHFLGPVPRDEFAKFLQRGFRSGGIALADGAIDAILDAAEEVPYNVQLLAHECWDRCRSEMARGKPLALTPELVREECRRVALRSDPLYTQLWSALPVTQQKALLAIVRERGAKLTSGALTKQYDISIPGMQKAIKGLEAKSIIREESRRGDVRLRLEDPLFGVWIDEVVAR